jgi:hypothetical protein
MDAELLMRNASMTVQKHNKTRYRRILRWKGKSYQYSNVVWNFLNPSDMLKSGEVIHHIDGDSLNDMPDNLQKMDSTEHLKHHQKNISLSTRKKLADNQRHRWINHTHCKRGHELTSDNVAIVIRKGKTGDYYEKNCKKCKSIRDKRYKEKRRGAVNCDAREQW